MKKNNVKKNSFVSQIQRRKVGEEWKKKCSTERRKEPRVE